MIRMISWIGITSIGDYEMKCNQGRLCCDAIVDNNEKNGFQKNISVKYIGSVYFYYSPEDLKSNYVSKIKERGNFVILFTNNLKDIVKIKLKLVNGGVEKKRIIEYKWYLLEPGFYMPINKIKSARVETLIFGMSHAQRSIDSFALGKHTYNLASGSMDLYYFLRLLQRMHGTGVLRRVRNVLFDIPYYYFNYDLSKCKYTFRQRTKMYRQINDYHNFVENDDEQYWILNHDILERIHKREFKEYIPVKIRYLRSEYKKSIVIRSANEGKKWSEEELLEIRNNISHVWSIYYDDTIEENISLWNQFKQIIKTYPQIRMRVIVMPFMKEFRISHMAEIEKMKSVFYNNIGSEVEVIDYFNLLENNEFFVDHCHMNDYGSRMFMKRLLWAMQE